MATAIWVGVDGRYQHLTAEAWLAMQPDDAPRVTITGEHWYDSTTGRQAPGEGTHFIHVRGTVAAFERASEALRFSGDPSSSRPALDRARDLAESLDCEAEAVIVAHAADALRALGVVA